MNSLDKDSTMKDIKKGKGLPPLNPQNGLNSNGTTSENRGEQIGSGFYYCPRCKYRRYEGCEQNPRNRRKRKGKRG